ncbi:hypothetical protein BGX34_003331 [Mortierella sp. NVP85]|nr:hypothetical protein BGX34_003331 [Mortierella sp. NVP85]
MDLDPEVQNSDKIDTAIPRQLVLDYLLHNCYGETARAFMKDDLDTVKDTDVRNGVGVHTQNGLNGNSNGTSSHHANGTKSTKRQVQGSVMVRNASDSSQRRSSLMMDTEKDEVDFEGDSPMGESYLDISMDSTFANGTHALHVDERLKNLETRKAIRNLISRGDIGSAMELCNSAFPGVLSVDPNSSLTTPASILMNFKLQCQKFIELVKSDDVKMDAEERAAQALMFAQEVLEQFKRLDPARKDMYVKELEEMTYVLAWSDPEASPNRHYLGQEARDQLADTMNSAVLGCNGMSCEPALLTIVKQTTVVREHLDTLDSSTKKRATEPKV